MNNQTIWDQDREYAYTLEKEHIHVMSTKYGDHVVMDIGGDESMSVSLGTFDSVKEASEEAQRILLCEESVIYVSGYHNSDDEFVWKTDFQLIMEAVKNGR